MRLLKWFAALNICVMAFVSFAMAQTVLLNVSYDPTREFYKDINAAFVAKWKAQTGENVIIRMSHGGSGRQARAVIDGLNADIVSLAVATDIDAIAEKGFISKDWRDRRPIVSPPYTSTIVFVVRKSNPKNIKDWNDLVRPGIGVIMPNPKTSGGARWSYLAAFAYGRQQFNNEHDVKTFMRQIYQNVPVLDTGARGSTTTFAQRGLGDVLVTWENEAFLTLKEFGTSDFEIITPSLSVKAEPDVAILDKNVDHKKTRKVTEAYFGFLYSETGQKLAAQHYYRPARPDLVDKDTLNNFSNIRLVTVDDVFGGWDKAQSAHFADGALFDQIYQAK